MQMFKKLFVLSEKSLRRVNLIGKIINQYLIDDASITRSGT